MKLSTKLQAKLAALVAALTGFVSWLAIVPPEQQSGMLGQLVSVLPLEYRPTIAVWGKLAMTISGFYATYKAAHSGPQTPPQNQPK